jgi:hypothetical protein
MSTKKYFCDGWGLSSIKTSETEYRVKHFIQEFKKFEDLLVILDLPINEIYLFSCDYGVHVQIEFHRDNYGSVRHERDVINSYLKAHLPMKNYDDVLMEYSKEITNHHFEYELDLGGYEFEYPSHDYFHLSLCS